MNSMALVRSCGQSGRGPPSTDGTRLARSSPAAGPLAVDHAQGPGRVVQHDGTVGTTDDDVLDPGAIAAREVDPRLDAECHPRAERLVVAGHQVRVLVALEADSVPGPVDERLAIALAVDDVPGGRVDRLGRGARADGPGRGLLRGEQHAEQVTVFLVRPVGVVAAGDPQGPGRVAVVPAERAADVEH